MSKSPSNTFNTKGFKAVKGMEVLSQDEVIDFIVTLLDMGERIAIKNTTLRRDDASPICRLTDTIENKRGLTIAVQRRIKAQKGRPIFLLDDGVDPDDVADTGASFLFRHDGNLVTFVKRGTISFHAHDLKRAIKKIERRDQKPFPCEQALSKYTAYHDLKDLGYMHAMFNAQNENDDITHDDAVNALCTHYAPEELKTMFFNYIGCTSDPAITPVSTFSFGARIGSIGSANEIQYKNADGRNICFLDEFAPMVLKKLQRYEFLTEQTRNWTPRKITRLSP